MFCSNCGKDIGDARYCPYCGHAQADDAQASCGPENAAFSPDGGGTTYRFRGDGIAELYREVFRDPLFLIICILVTASAVLSFLFTKDGSGKYTFSIGILDILYAIALWLIFAAARNENRFSGTGLAMASGVVKASFIITWIVAVIVLVAGVLVVVFGPLAIESIDFDFTRNAPVLQTNLISPAPGGSGSIPLPEGFEWLDGLDSLDGLDKIPHITSISLRLIGAALIIAAIVVAVINMLYTRNLHRFTKSLCTSLANDRYNIEKANTSKVWLIISAVFSVLVFGVNILLVRRIPFDAVTVIRQICGVLAMILSAVMIGRHFSKDYRL